MINTPPAQIMKIKLQVLALVIVCLSASSTVAQTPKFINPNGIIPIAQVPGVVSHQGKITVDGTNYTGLGEFKFALVNTAGNITYWSNDGSSTSGGEPASPISLPVARGIFAVNLGDTNLTNMKQPISSVVFAKNDVFLRVWFSDGLNGFELLMPDQRITSVGYAFKASISADFAASPAASIQASNITIWNNKVGGNGTANVIPKFTAGGTVGDSVLYSDASGHVGIGISNPAYPLEVLGDVNVTGQIRVNGTVIGATGPVSKARKVLPVWMAPTVSTVRPGLKASPVKSALWAPQVSRVSPAKSVPQV